MFWFEVLFYLILCLKIIKIIKFVYCLGCRGVLCDRGNICYGVEFVWFEDNFGY